MFRFLLAALCVLATSAFQLPKLPAQLNKPIAAASALAVTAHSEAAFAKSVREQPAGNAELPVCLGDGGGSIFLSA